MEGCLGAAERSTQGGCMKRRHSRWSDDSDMIDSRWVHRHLDLSDDDAMMPNDYISLLP